MWQELAHGRKASIIHDQVLRSRVEVGGQGLARRNIVAIAEVETGEEQADRVPLVCLNKFFSLSRALHTLKDPQAGLHGTLK